MSFTLACKGNQWHLMPYTAKELEKIFSLALEHMPTNYFAELWVCDDTKSYYLNKNYLHGNCPTNILSFPDNENTDKNNIFLGSLALNGENLHREAFLYHQELKDHCIGLLFHGIAHLFGYDHGEEMENFCESCISRISL